MTYTQVWDIRINAIDHTMIKRDEDGAFIPCVEGNADFEAYKQWVEQGNAPKPAGPPAPIQGMDFEPNVTPPSQPPQSSRPSKWL